MFTEKRFKEKVGDYEISGGTYRDEKGNVFMKSRYVRKLNWFEKNKRDKRERWVLIIAGIIFVIIFVTTMMCYEQLVFKDIQNVQDAYCNTNYKNSTSYHELNGTTRFYCVLSNGTKINIDNFMYSANSL